MGKITKILLWVLIWLFHCWSHAALLYFILKHRFFAIYRNLEKSSGPVAEKLQGFIQQKTGCNSENEKFLSVTFHVVYGQKSSLIFITMFYIVSNPVKVRIAVFLLP